MNMEKVMSVSMAALMMVTLVVRPADSMEEFQYSPYAQDTAEVMKPAASINKHEAIVLVHGGSFQYGSDTQANVMEIAHAAVAEGYTVVSINYRLDSKASPMPNAIEAQVEDVQAAIRWTKANAGMLGINPNKVAIGGLSAGAELAMTASSLGYNEHTYQTDPRNEAGRNAGYSTSVSAVLDFSGITDLQTLSGGLHTVANMVASGNKQEEWEMSPLAHVANAAPTFIAQGTQDTLIHPNMQVNPYINKLQQQNIEYERVNYVGGHALASTSPTTAKRVIHDALGFLGGIDGE